MQRLYFDNAATSSPKPPQVLRAMIDYATRLGGSPGRGGYHESREAGRLLWQCRQRICTLLGADSPDHVVFTLNTTDALNLAIKGLILARLARDPRATAHIVITAMEHNSVLRPVNALVSLFPGRCTVTRAGADPESGLIDPADIRRAVLAHADTALVILNHAGNVTGAIQPAAEIGRICRELEVPFLLDAAQSLGHIPVDAGEVLADLIAFPGHKGLLGPTGTGGLYIRPGFEHQLATIREGGTGSQSDLDIHPDTLPDKYEAGSTNTIGLIGLSEGVNFLLNYSYQPQVRDQPSTSDGTRTGATALVGIQAIAAHERDLVNLFLSGLLSSPSPPLNAPRSSIPLHPNLHLHGPRDPAARVGVFAVTIDALDPHDLAAILESSFGLLTRAGVHCAPFAHQTLGTTPAPSPAPGANWARAGSGAVRFSLGPFLTPSDIKRATDALAEICREHAHATPPAAAGAAR